MIRTSKLIRGALALALLTGVVGGITTPAAAADPGTPWTWGANPYGQLGDGTTTAHVTARPISRSDVTDIAGGRGHVIALLSAGTVVAWGENANGQLGIGTSGNRSTPTAVTGLSSVIAVAAGHYHSLAL